MKVSKKCQFSEDSRLDRGVCVRDRLVGENQERKYKRKLCCQCLGGDCSLHCVLSNVSSTHWRIEEGEAISEEEVIVHSH